MVIIDLAAEFFGGGTFSHGCEFGADLRGGAHPPRLSQNFGGLLGNRNKFPECQVTCGQVSSWHVPISLVSIYCIYIIQRY